MNNRPTKRRKTQNRTSNTNNRQSTKKHSVDFWQFEKLRSAEAYYQNLQLSNQKSLQYFQDVIKHIYIAFASSILLYGLTYLLALAALIVGLVTILNSESENQVWAAVSIFVGIVILLFLIRKDPLRNTFDLINNLARFNVIFTGYMRQIHQVDATFREMFLSADEITLEDLETVLSRIQLTIDNALDSMNQIIEDFDN